MERGCEEEMKRGSEEGEDEWTNDERRQRMGRKVLITMISLGMTEREVWRR